MVSLKEKDPDAEFVGIGGALMLEKGLKSVFPMDQLTVMGIWEVLMRLPQLLICLENLYCPYPNHKTHLYRWRRHF